MFSRRDASTPGQTPHDEPLTRPEQQAVAPFQASPMAIPTTSAQSPATNMAESVIAKEDTFEGQIKTGTGVRVQGTVRGNIESQRSVRIDAGATVEADITAEEVIIAGTYRGNLTCRDRVEITSTGHVSGKLETAKMFLHEGGFFDGELHMQRSSEEPARATTTEGDGSSRPRRSRYVDISGDNPRPVPENASEAGRTEEPAAQG